jgi:hypothetical protein
MSCEKHKRNVEGFDGSLEDLAEKLGDLHYEALAEFLDYFSKKIERDAQADEDRGRMKLSGSLLMASDELMHAQIYINNAWKISKPYMDKDREEKR